MSRKNIMQSLTDFYTNSSEKRSSTRKKPWPEFDHILTYINEVALANQQRIGEGKAKKEAEPLRILELGCGDGRFAEYLDKHFEHDFVYIGIDSSKGLIDIANKTEYDNKISFQVHDMMDIVSYQDQQSVDVVVSIASIQHLHYRHRQALWNEVYRILNYGGKHITTNWSYSSWFFSKHWNAIIAGWVLQLFNNRVFSRSDYIIPFQSPKSESKSQDLKTEFRFYHIYSRNALKHLASVA